MVSVLLWGGTHNTVHWEGIYIVGAHHRIGGGCGGSASTIIGIHGDGELDLIAIGKGQGGGSEVIGEGARGIAGAVDGGDELALAHGIGSGGDFACPHEDVLGASGHAGGSSRSFAAVWRP